MSLTLKLTSLGIRTVAKPLGNLIKRQAREHEGFRQACVRFAQGLHRLDARMRLGLLEDSEAIARQIDKEAANAEAKRLRSQQRSGQSAPTVKTKEQVEAEELAKSQERKLIEGKVRNDGKKKEKQLLKPLSESKAIDTGANFASEAFVFLVAVGLLLFENFRGRRKASDRRENVDDRLDRLEGEVKRAQDAETYLEKRVGSLLDEIQVLRTTGENNGKSNGESNGESAGSTASSTPNNDQSEVGNETTSSQKEQFRASSQETKSTTNSPKEA